MNRYRRVFFYDIRSAAGTLDGACVLCAEDGGVVEKDVELEFCVIVRGVVGRGGDMGSKFLK
jgi:hypothetical protein